MRYGYESTRFTKAIMAMFFTVAAAKVGMDLAGKYKNKYEQGQYGSGYAPVVIKAPNSNSGQRGFPSEQRGNKGQGQSSGSLPQAPRQNPPVGTIESQRVYLTEGTSIGTDQFCMKENGNTVCGGQSDSKCFVLKGKLSCQGADYKIPMQIGKRMNFPGYPRTECVSGGTFMDCKKFYEIPQTADYEKGSPAGPIAVEYNKVADPGRYSASTNTPVSTGAGGAIGR